MDAKAYCRNVSAELTGWKAKLYDVIRKTEKLPADDRETINPMVSELNSLVDDLNQSISQLTRECPAEWDSDRANIEENISKMQHKWKEVWGVMGDKEYGLGGA
jgi:hypothetical protein